MEFLLNRGGLRVVFGKTQGLFNKNARPNRYLGMSAVGSGSKLDLILGVCYRSGGQGCNGVRAAAEERRRPSSAAARLGEGSGDTHNDGGRSARWRIAGARVLATRASFGL
jgi:hypothetical protein